MFDKPQSPQNPHQPQPQHTSFNPLSSKPKKPDPAAAKMAGDVNEIMRRLRVLEERYSNLRKKNQLTDQNMLDDTKRVSTEIRAMQTTISELKKELMEVNSKIIMLNEEIAQSVPKRDLRLLSKYLDFWQPLDFVRKDEVRKIVEQTIEDIKRERRGQE